MRTGMRCADPGELCHRGLDMLTHISQVMKFEVLHSVPRNLFRGLVINGCLLDGNHGVQSPVSGCVFKPSKWSYNLQSSVKIYQAQFFDCFRRFVYSGKIRLVDVPWKAPLGYDALGPLCSQ
jgi:hypothetical protein